MEAELNTSLWKKPTPQLEQSRGTSPIPTTTVTPASTPSNTTMSADCIHHEIILINCSCPYLGDFKPIGFNNINEFNNYFIKFIV